MPDESFLLIAAKLPICFPEAAPSAGLPARTHFDTSNMDTTRVFSAYECLHSVSHGSMTGNLDTNKDRQKTNEHF